MVFHPNYVPMTERMREIIADQERDFPFVAMDDQLE